MGTVAVEGLLREIKALAPEPGPEVERFDLKVPELLTLRGQPVALDIAMAVLLDALLAKGFEPDGYEVRPGGRCYRYWRGRAA